MGGLVEIWIDQKVEAGSGHGTSKAGLRVRMAADQSAEIGLTLEGDPVRPAD